MSWIYLSPHFDDVALSCGGLAWEQAHSGEAANVWTICAGRPPEGPFSPFAESLHLRWHTGSDTVARRRLEDQASCALLGAAPKYFDVPDCIYRRSEVDGVHLYASDDAIMGPLHPLEAPLLEQLGQTLRNQLPKRARIVAPLALGGHVDHRLVRQAAEGLGWRLWYYADLPYVLSRGDELEKLCEAGWKARVFPLSEASLVAWQAAIAAHASQVSTFWPDLESMDTAIREYSRENQGIRLWRAPG